MFGYYRKQLIIHFIKHLRRMHHRFNETISVNDDLIVLRVMLTNRIEENAR